MVSIYEYRLLEVRCTAFGTILIARKMTSLSDLGCVECYWRCVIVARFVAVWRPAVWGERWLFSPPQRPLCFVARVRRVGRRKKESALWQMQLAIGFCFKNEQTLELLVPYPPYRVFALKGWEGFLPYRFGWLYSTSASWKWCLRNMTTERRGRQNVCVWQTWQGYSLRVLSWSLVIIVFLSCLKESEVWQKTFKYYSRALHSSFAVFFPFPSFCVSSIMCFKVGVTDFGRTLVSVTLGIFLTLIK